MQSNKVTSACISYHTLITQWFLYIWQTMESSTFCPCTLLTCISTPQEIQNLVSRTYKWIERKKRVNLILPNCYHMNQRNRWPCNYSITHWHNRPISPQVSPQLFQLYLWTLMLLSLTTCNHLPITLFSSYKKLHIVPPTLLPLSYSMLITHPKTASSLNVT